ncbi:hypothetical protein [Roseibium aggregatum]|uniref:Uncharacterized protein n=1 Tax=Roseibium aggregatum TaxID=187304 RepID=A0A926P1S6_9HYPH|nr:hypothetical protein [Roseibium aggregatum]MBD1548310.1 hypothetical protein [Roseibium aggregatum]
MRRLYMIAAFILGLIVTPAMAEVVVVATSGDAGLHAGQKLDPAVQISLPEGARITVLSKTGEMKVIDGPYTGPVEAQDDKPQESVQVAQWDAVKTFLGDPDARSEVVGASRSAKSDLLASPSSIWDVSVDSSGPRCTRASGLVLWRKRSTLPLTVSVRGPGVRVTDLDWPKGENSLPLPDNYTAEDGTMVVSLDGNLRELSIKVLPKDMENAAPGQLLAWMVDNKCARQALSLIAHVHARTEIK